MYIKPLENTIYIWKIVSYLWILLRKIFCFSENCIYRTYHKWIRRNLSAIQSSLWQRKIFAKLEPFLMEKYSLYNCTHTHLRLNFILHWEKSSKLTKTFLSAIGQINIYHFWRQAYIKLVQCCLEWSDDKSMTTWQHFKIYWCGGTLNENISYKNSPSINIKKNKNQT